MLSQILRFLTNPVILIVITGLAILQKHIILNRKRKLPGIIIPALSFALSLHMALIMPAKITTVNSESTNFGAFHEVSREEKPVDSYASNAAGMFVCINSATLVFLSPYLFVNRKTIKPALAGDTESI